MIYRDGQQSRTCTQAAPYRTFADLMNVRVWRWHMAHLVRTGSCIFVKCGRMYARASTLELRASDGLPWPYFSAAPAIWVGLTYDATVRKEASALLSELTPFQLEHAVNDIAIKGLAASVGPYPVQDLAHELLRLARQGLENRVAGQVDPPEVLSYLEPLEQVDGDGETFADKCLTLWHSELGQSPEAYVRRFRIPFEGARSA